MNAIGGEVIEGINKAIDLAEKGYKGLVVANNGENFSAGANLGMIFMLAIEQEWDELDMAVRAFQNAMMRVRYSSIPVVVAPHGLALVAVAKSLYTQIKFRLLPKPTQVWLNLVLV